MSGADCVHHDDLQAYLLGELPERVAQAVHACLARGFAWLETQPDLPLEDVKELTGLRAETEKAIRRAEWVTRSGQVHGSAPPRKPQ